MRVSQNTLMVDIRTPHQNMLSATYAHPAILETIKTPVSLNAKTAMLELPTLPVIFLFNNVKYKNYYPRNCHTQCHAFRLFPHECM